MGEGRDKQAEKAAGKAAETQAEAAAGAHAGEPAGKKAADARAEKAAKAADAQAEKAAATDAKPDVAAMRDKLVHDVEHELDVIAHGDPATERRLREFDATQAATEKQAQERWYKRLLTTPPSEKKLPVGVKVFAVLLLVGAALGLAALAEAVMHAVGMYRDGSMETLGTSTVVVTWVRLANLLVGDLAFVFLAVQLLRGKRNIAALVIYAIYVVLIVGDLCALMLYGIDFRLAIYIVLIALLIAFQVYLDPHLREERQLQRMLRDNEIKHEQEAGILGRDLSGKGYIKLDFFNLFWIFVICSILGDVMETIFHVVVIDPGHWQDRAGLLFGPFSPIYGCGAVLMTLFLNRLYRKNVILVFLLSAVIGGAFEVFVSYFMQYAYGAVAWNYSGMFLSLFGGRTCGLFMAIWGALGVVWLRLLLPLMLALIGKIPWKWRYSLTTVAALLMATDCVMSLQALDCWYERLAHDPINTPIKEFYARYFDDAWMANRFQSMTIDPASAVRGGH